jgi:hypothetical protein
VNVLSVTWYAATIAGVAAAAAGWAQPVVRTPAPLVAVACSGPAGVLGLLSIGSAIIMVAAGCLPLAGQAGSVA